MNKNGIFGICVVIPFVVSVVSAYIQSVWLAVVAFIVVFILVSVLPFCHKHENLWIFIMIAFVSIPINLFILKKYDLWIMVSPAKEDSGLIFYMSLFQYALILSSIEEIISGMIGRLIWRKQYKLFIPVKEDDE